MARVQSPVRSGARARLERRVEPLYDNAVITSTSVGAVRLFHEPIGTNSKTILDTNMGLPSSLPTPRVFDILGFELRISQGLTTRSAGIAAAESQSNQTSQFFNGMKGILFGSWMQMRVGTKDYVEAPSFLLPSNQRIGGNVVGGPAVNGTFANGLREIFAQSIGMTWSIANRPIRLIPNQTFGATINIPTAGVVAASASHVAYLFLHGLHYVEVQ
ncbi:MAG: hypothetical protein ACF8XB_09715 [Planctomycetota bacterium JB042]